MNQEYKPSSFISKFHSMLKNKNFQRIIKYDENKTTIVIFDKEKLENEILPYFFRHNKFTSFIRQLNLYGFKKIKNCADLSFTHPSLLRGDKFLSIVAKKKLDREDPQDQDRNPTGQPRPETPSDYNSLRQSQILREEINPSQTAHLLPLASQNQLLLPTNPESFIQHLYMLPFASQGGMMMAYHVPIQPAYHPTNSINYFQPF